MVALKFIIGITGLLSICMVVEGYSTQQNQDKSKANSTKNTTLTFQSDILPLLKKNCMPCHFAGGTVYDRYPFENYKTVFALRKRLHTRLKSEQLDVVNAWIDSGAKEK